MECRVEIRGKRLRARNAARELDRCDSRRMSGPCAQGDRIVVDISPKKTGVEASGVTIAALVVAARKTCCRSFIELLR